MESDWVVSTFDDAPLEIIDGDRGVNYPTQADFRPTGHCLFLNAGNVTTNGFNFSDCAFISAEKDTKLRKGKLSRYDVVLTTRGTVGNVAYFDESISYDHIRINSGMVIFRARPQELLPRYLYLFLRSSSFQSQVASLRTGSAQPQLPIRDINRIEIPIPPLSEQRVIAHILGTLNDKIELNRRMNETLEAMARAIFKSWFVDFDPVRAKTEGRDTGLPKHIADLFPDRFENSELGEIPAGWRIATIGDVCCRIAMGPFGSDIKTNNFVNFGVPVVRGVNLTNGFVEESFVFVSEEKANQLRNANAFPGDIVITHRGTLGQVALIPEPSVFPRYVVSQSQMLLSIDRNIASPRYVHDFMRSPAGQHALLANTSQTGVPAIARPTSSVRAIKMILPPIRVLKNFELLVGTFYTRRNRAIDESRTLANLRDTLLPKLISGDLRVKETEISLEIQV